MTDPLKGKYISDLKALIGSLDTQQAYLKERLMKIDDKLNDVKFLLGKLEDEITK